MSPFINGPSRPVRPLFERKVPRRLFGVALPLTRKEVLIGEPVLPAVVVLSLSRGKFDCGQSRFVGVRECANP